MARDLKRGLKIFAAGFFFGCVTMVITGFLLWDPPRTADANTVYAGSPAVTSPTRVVLPREDPRTLPPENFSATVPPDVSKTFSRSIRIPVQGVTAADIRDTFDEMRGSNRKHEATDIIAPRGTAVLAADDGTIKKLFMSDQGGITLYQFDPTEQFSYYYAHLDRYADGIREGMAVKQGDVIGYVGTTGNAPPNTPHLHFGIFQLGAERKWWEGIPINPYAFLIAKAR
jgi:murein DD-endopeptidase MepM/ murein hydrolase activator NlpD